MHSRGDLALQPRRFSIPATRQRPDYHSVTRIEIGDHGAGGVPEKAGDMVAVDRIADGFADHEPHPGSVNAIGFVPCMNDQIALSNPNSLLDGGAKLG